MPVNFHDIEQAAKLLGLGDRASLQQVKDAYKKLIQQWHPDRCGYDKEVCNEMTGKITEAYKLLIAFCNSYKIPLTEHKLVEELTDDDPELFWKRKFGSDPHWGGPGYKT
ncbi:MAG: J domain-containing protein [Spirochaetes bacterium]|nr:J domain-containing protein [Spirochaetota bacterium]